MQRAHGHQNEDHVRQRSTTISTEHITCSLEYSNSFRMSQQWHLWGS